MTQHLYAILILLIVFVIGESTWLYLMRPMYKEWLAPYNRGLVIQSTWAAVLAYVGLLGAFYFLVLRKISTSGAESVLSGIAFGLAVYGTYNLTNMATLTHYSWQMVCADTAWGTLWFGLLAGLMWYITRTKK